MDKPRDKWQLVTEFTLHQYACGVEAGQQVRLIRSFDIKDHRDNRTGRRHFAGEIWTVLRGSEADDPPVVWLRQPDGEMHTWDDSPEFWSYFRRIEQ